MRVYTNQPLRIVWSYTKFALTVAVLFVLASQAFKVWSNEPAVKDLQQIMETVQPQ